MGIISDKQIIKCILLNNNKDNILTDHYKKFLKGCIFDAMHIKTQNDALEYMSKYITYTNYNKYYPVCKKELVKNILIRDFLPHISIDNPDLKQKVLFIGYMTNCLLNTHFKNRPIDDRDSYINKRINTPGILMANLFKQYFTKVIKDMKTQINKEFNNGCWRASNNFSDLINVSNIYKIIKFNIIATGLKYALATGNWGIKNINNKAGIAQVLSRLTYNSTLSHLRRINTPIEKNGKLVGPRKLHNTQAMIMCPAETPEGASIGAVKNLALGAIISSYVSPEPIIKIIDNLNCLKTKDLDISEENIGNYTKIFINGAWYSNTKYPVEVYDNLIQKRRKGIINIYIGITWNINEHVIDINTSAGRCFKTTIYY